MKYREIQAVSIERSWKSNVYNFNKNKEIETMYNDRLVSNILDNYLSNSTKKSTVVGKKRSSTIKHQSNLIVGEIIIKHSVSKVFIYFNYYLNFTAESNKKKMMKRLKFRYTNGLRQILSDSTLFSWDYLLLSLDNKIQSKISNSNKYSALLSTSTKNNEIITLDNLLKDVYPNKEIEFVPNKLKYPFMDKNILEKYIVRLLKFNSGKKVFNRLTSLMNLKNVLIAKSGNNNVDQPQTLRESLYNSYIKGLQLTIKGRSSKNSKKVAVGRSKSSKFVAGRFNLEAPGRINTVMPNTKFNDSTKLIGYMNTNISKSNKTFVNKGGLNNVKIVLSY
jgi:Mitochondrial ribosomal protein (VAR1)